MEFNEPFILRPLLGAETSAVEDEHRRILSLLFGESFRRFVVWSGSSYSGKWTLEPCRIAFEVLQALCAPLIRPRAVTNQWSCHPLGVSSR
jgi:hypothetical protein